MASMSTGLLDLLLSVGLSVGLSVLTFWGIGGLVHWWFYVRRVDVRVDYLIGIRTE